MALVATLRCFAFWIVLSSCSPPSPEPAAEPPTSGTVPSWSELSSAFIEATFTIDPRFAISAGRHEHDGEIGDLSAAGIEKLIAHHRAWLERARAFDPTKLSSRDAFERDLLIWWCDSRLFWLQEARWPFRNPEYYSRYFSPSVYVTREYAAPAERLAALTKHLANARRGLAEMRKNLSAPLPKPYVERALGFFAGMATYHERDVPAVFADVADAELQSAFAAANSDAIAAFRETAQWLEGQRATAPEAFAMGEALFREMLARTELVDRDLDDVEADNQRDKARNRAALDAACSVIAPAASTAECVARVDRKKPTGGPVARGTEQLVELKRFVVEHDLVSVPLPDEARVAEAPPYRRANLAYIERPGPYEKVSLPSIYYIAPPDPAWSQEEQRAYLPSEAHLLFISSHEVWPGHFLQGLHQRAHAGPLGQLLSSGASTEGWAHYAEEMMWDAGLGDGNAELHVGQLIAALWRNVRYESAIGLHARGMTLAESERAFREEAFLDPGNARQQAARGAYDPGYLAYTLGKLEILKLRNEWSGSRGGRDAWKAFHDALLAFGAPPVSLARKYLITGD